MKITVKKKDFEDSTHVAEGILVYILIQSIYVVLVRCTSLYLAKKDDNLYFVHGDWAFGIIDKTPKLNKTILVY